MARGHFPLPVVGETQPLELPTHGVDVVPRPLFRRDVVLDGRVLRRQAEGVPTHGMEHVPAVHPFEAGHHVSDGVVADVAHVAAPRRVREHLQAVVLGAAAAGVKTVNPLLFPALLPLHLQRLVIVVRHAIHPSLRVKSPQKRKAASLRDGMRAFRGTTLISARRASAPSSSPWITAGSRHGLQGPGGPFSLRLQGELRRRVPCRLAPAGGSLERDVPAYFSPSSSFPQGDTPSIDSLVYHDAAGWSILPAPGGPVAGPRFAAVPARLPRGAIEAADPQQCQ